jgi:hypothetical protein
MRFCFLSHHGFEHGPNPYPFLALVGEESAPNTFAFRHHLRRHLLVKRPTCVDACGRDLSNRQLVVYKQDELLALPSLAGSLVLSTGKPRGGSLALTRLWARAALTAKNAAMAGKFAFVGEVRLEPQ